MIGITPFCDRCGKPIVDTYFYTLWIRPVYVTEPDYERIMCPDCMERIKDCMRGKDECDGQTGVEL